MNESEISVATSTAVGAVTVWLTQLIRHQVIKLDGRSALSVSLVVALVGTLFAYFNIDKTPTIVEFFSNFGVVIASSQVVYGLLTREIVSKTVPGEIKE